MGLNEISWDSVDPLDRHRPDRSTGRFSETSADGIRASSVARKSSILLLNHDQTKDK